MEASLDKGELAPPCVLRRVARRKLATSSASRSSNNSNDKNTCPACAFSHPAFHDRRMEMQAVIGALGCTRTMFDRFRCSCNHRIGLADWPSLHSTTLLFCFARRLTRSNALKDHRPLLRRINEKNQIRACLCARFVVMCI